MQIGRNNQLSFTGFPGPFKLATASILAGGIGCSGGISGGDSNITTVPDTLRRPTETTEEVFTAPSYSQPGLTEYNIRVHPATQTTIAYLLRI